MNETFCRFNFQYGQKSSYSDSASWFFVFPLFMLVLYKMNIWQSYVSKLWTIFNLLSRILNLLIYVYSIV